MILTKHSELARSHLTITANKPSLLDPAKFEEEVRTAKSLGFDRQRREVQAEFPTDNLRGNGAMFTAGRKKSRLDTINRQAALWIPITPRLLVIGSRLNPDTVREMQTNTDDANRDATGAPLLQGTTT
jgi:hypothetical protein